MVFIYKTNGTAQPFTLLQMFGAVPPPLILDIGPSFGDCELLHFLASNTCQSCHVIDQNFVKGVRIIWIIPRKNHLTNEPFHLSNS